MGSDEQKEYICDEAACGGGNSVDTRQIYFRSAPPRPADARKIYRSRRNSLIIDRVR